MGFVNRKMKNHISFFRKFKKNFCNRLRASSCKMPPWQIGLHSKEYAESFKRLSQAPALGSFAAYTMRPILAFTAEPAHIIQGSSVTYKVHSDKRQLPSRRQASAMARASA